MIKTLDELRDYIDCEIIDARVRYHTVSYNSDAYLTRFNTLQAVRKHMCGEYLAPCTHGNCVRPGIAMCEGCGSIGVWSCHICAGDHLIRNAEEVAASC